MALTPFQRDVCRELARHRRASGESYIAGGAALNELTAGGRVSRDLDLFHDTREALIETWNQDQNALRKAGWGVEPVLERPTFVEALVRRGEDTVLLQWTHDSAFRFFPLLEHEELGLVLHPFDLATNKVLALVGRVEARDWIDTMHCDDTVQPLGLLAWACSGKDPGWSPDGIVEHAARSTRYSADEIEALEFDSSPPDPSALSSRWRRILETAREMIALLPSDQVGACVLAENGLFNGGTTELHDALAAGAIRFHRGTIRGAFPQVLE